MRRRPKVYAELDPGDALFFHCNLLHASGQNTSDRPRWSIISAYNALTNAPLRGEEPRSCVAPIARVPDAALLDPDAGGVAADTDFLDKSSRGYQDRRD
jgi:phytanoyl-CoA hydroxylase